MCLVDISYDDLVYAPSADSFGRTVDVPVSVGTNYVWLLLTLL